MKDERVPQRRSTPLRREKALVITSPDLAMGQHIKVQPFPSIIKHY